MRPRIAWVRISDLDILEFLDGHTLEIFEAPPTPIALNMNLAEGTVWQRMTVLKTAGLVERTDEERGYYKITDLGHRYLEDELTDDERQHLEEFDPDNI
jgi:predicted transcriptional regulator